MNENTEITDDFMYVVPFGLFQGNANGFWDAIKLVPYIDKFVFTMVMNGFCHQLCRKWFVIGFFLMISLSFVRLFVD